MEQRTPVATFMLHKTRNMAFRWSQFYAAKVGESIKIFEFYHEMEGDYPSPAYAMIFESGEQDFQSYMAKMTNIRNLKFIETINPPFWN
jgi:hypothetical protein